MEIDAIVVGMKMTQDNEKVVKTIENVLAERPLATIAQIKNRLKAAGFQKRFAEGGTRSRS